MKKQLYIIIFLANFGVSYNISAQQIVAQREDKYKSIGVMIGPVTFRSDYGQRGNFDNFANNSGMAYGLLYYMIFDGDRNSISQHLSHRLDVCYMINDLQHYGQWTEGTGIGAKQLREMRGKISAIDIGFQTEYYPWKNEDNSFKILSPYISLGFQYNLYNYKNWSTLGGSLAGNINQIPEFINTSESGSGGVFSISTSIGTRIKIGEESSLLFDLKAQFYGSDFVEGMDPINHVGNPVSQNVSNDWLTWLSVGYIHSFGDDK